jgi:alkylation response protein AidB-like acyl-CoA dehydrogenase
VDPAALGAERRFDTWVLNGAKMWSTGASHADWGMCLARTDWQVPKHRGLSMVAVPLRGTPGVQIEPIRYVTGEEAEFCQEFFDDVALPLDHLIGEENGGWAVAQSLLNHERLATAGVGHGYGLLPHNEDSPGASDEQSSLSAMVAAVRTRASVGADAGLGQLLAESHIEHTVHRFANDRIMTGLRTGYFRGQWGSLLKLRLGAMASRHAKTALSVAGADAVIWDGDAPVAHNAGESWLACRTISIAGGTNEMQRNIVSERLLGLPREPSHDRDLPFSEVLHSRAPVRKDAN